MANTFLSDPVGTLRTYFKIGSNLRLKNTAGAFEVRSGDDSAYANIAVAQASIGGAGGPRLRSNAGVFEVRDSADTGYSDAAARTINLLGTGSNIIELNTVGGTDELFNQTYEAFKFNTGSNNALGSVVVQLKKDAGVSAGSYVQAMLYGETAGVPSFFMGNALAPIYAASISTSYSFAEFAFSVNLSTSTNYWVVFAKNVTGGNINFNSTTGTNTWAWSSNLSSWTLENKKPYYIVKAPSAIGTNSASYNGIAVQGTSTIGTGVSGYSSNGIAVGGKNFNGSGVHGQSTYGIGVSGTSDYGYAASFKRNNTTPFSNTPVVYISQEYAFDTNVVAEIRQFGTGEVLRLTTSGSSKGLVIKPSSTQLTSFLEAQDTGSNLLASIGGDGRGKFAPRDSSTNTILPALTLNHASSGVPTTNFGTQLLLQAHSSSQVDRELVSLEGYWTTATDGSRKAKGEIFVWDTAKRSAIGVEADGTAVRIGFLGATPAIRQTGGVATAGATYTANEQNMLQKAYSALRTFGLLT